jgi:hypothetical protein
MWALDLCGLPLPPLLRLGEALEAGKEVFLNVQVSALVYHYAVAQQVHDLFFVGFHWVGVVKCLRISAATISARASSACPAVR